MKQSLSLRMSQHLALTPQLQQSIRLLQLSTLELSQEVEQMLDENPFLERSTDEAPQEDFGLPEADARVSLGDRVSEAASEAGAEEHAGDQHHAVAARLGRLGARGGGLAGGAGGLWAPPPGSDEDAMSRDESLWFVIAAFNEVVKAGADRDRSKNEGRLGPDDLADKARVAVDELGPVGSLVGGGVAEVVRQFVQDNEFA